MLRSILRQLLKGFAENETYFTYLHLHRSDIVLIFREYEMLKLLCKSNRIEVFITFGFEQG